MKKIISLLCVFAMMFAFVTINANAAITKAYGAEIVKASEDGDVVTYDIYVIAEEDLKTFSVVYDIDPALNAGAVVTAGDAVVSDVTIALGNKKNTSTGMTRNWIVSGYLSLTGGTFPAGTTKIGSFTIDYSNVAAGTEFDLAMFVSDAKVKKNSSFKTDVTITDFEIASLTCAKPGVAPEEDKVVMTATPFITEVATSEEKDGWQAGQAVALQFATADLADFIAMNWKLTVADVNKFAKVDDAAFATIKATAAETVDVFASFIVNTAENKTATPITAVSAGFLKADGTVVEAE